MKATMKVSMTVKGLRPLFLLDFLSIMSYNIYKLEKAMKFKKSEKALYKHAIGWYQKRMNLEGVKIRLEIEDEPFFYGRCGVTKKKKAYVFISPLPDAYTKLCTLFHELTHVHQFIRGDLVVQSWKGEDYSDVEYDNQPWEIEAHAVENVLADLYLKEEWK